MASTARMIQHSECVDERIAGRKGMVANEGKHWVLTNRIAGKENLAANYGWFIKGRRPVQTVGTRHDTAHTDYSQIVRLVKPIMNVDGRDIDIRHVGSFSRALGSGFRRGTAARVARVEARRDAEPERQSRRARLRRPSPGTRRPCASRLKSEGMPVSARTAPQDHDRASAQHVLSAASSRRCACDPTTSPKRPFGPRELRPAAGATFSSSS